MAHYQEAGVGPNGEITLLEGLEPNLSENQIPMMPDMNVGLSEFFNREKFRTTFAAQKGSRDHDPNDIRVFCGFDHGKIYETSSFVLIREMTLGLAKEYPEHQIIFLFEGVDFTHGYEAKALNKLKKNGVAIFGSESKEMMGLITKQPGQPLTKSEIDLVGEISGVSVKKEECAKILMESPPYMIPSRDKRDESLPEAMDFARQQFPGGKTIIVVAGGCGHTANEENTGRFDFILNEDDHVRCKPYFIEQVPPCHQEIHGASSRAAWQKNKCGPSNEIINPTISDEVDCGDILEDFKKREKKDESKAMENCQKNQKNQKKIDPSFSCERPSGSGYFSGAESIQVSAKRGGRG